MSDQVVEEKVIEDFIDVPIASKKTSPKKVLKQEIVMSFNQFLRGQEVNKYTRAYWEHEYRGILKSQKDWEIELEGKL